MPLSWNEIKSRAMTFTREWTGVSSEHAEAKSFWDDFFNIFGVSRRRVATFEQHVKKIDDCDGYIDLLWKGVLLVEHKSRGKNLNRAQQQAMSYFPGLKERDLPRYILVCDFENFKLYDLDTDDIHEFVLSELHENVHLFGFIAGYQTHRIREEDPVNIKAAERMGLLHDQLKDAGYTGHALEVYLVRLLFCMFADDTGIFHRQQLQEYVELRTLEDGSDLGHHLATLFHVLNTPVHKRMKNLDEQLDAFPYINGNLFSEYLPPASFNSAMRQNFLDSCALDWSKISPAIFGSLFQSIMDRKARRNLGAHYTTEQNILKLIKPLFLDSLWDTFNKIKRNRKKLAEFHDDLRKLTFFDPACGCGNFLVIAYRELRLLELEILRILNPSGQKIIDINSLLKLDIDQFYGIEIEEFPAQIAQVALWLMDHQMNLKVSEEFGLYFARIPLRTSAHIICGNALDIEWNDVIPVDRLNFILGNPPFIGAKFLRPEQRSDMAIVTKGIKSSGLLDYVSAWYIKATHLIQNTRIRCAFVSTNSITQGEQVGVLWKWMLEQGIRIFFAHRTFQWSSEARGKAAVHCVIIGFSTQNIMPKYIFEYEDVKGDPHQITAQNINPYLVDASNALLSKRSKPISDVAIMKFGNQPIDGGGFVLSSEDRYRLIKKYPLIAKFIRKYIGSNEFLKNRDRYCLWLLNSNPQELKTFPEILERLNSIRRFRESSKRKATRELASSPTSFAFISHTESTYIIVPSVSSERRIYIPIGFMPPSVIASNLCLIIPGAGVYEFGILQSLMHNAWTRTVCGRLESRYRYSIGIVYNNFPWPRNPTDKQRMTIEMAARAILEVRASFKDSSLADLYDPLLMPPVLLKAHQVLDRAVDKTYRKARFSSEAERVAFLFDLYRQYTS